jgi:hypothetical protein
VCLESKSQLLHVVLCDRCPLDIFGAENANMKELLRKGTAADLNVYITNLNNGGIIGCVVYAAA